MSEEFNQNQEKDIEVTEISLTDEEINEWIVELAMLKSTRNQIQLELDEENELQINYEETSDEEPESFGGGGE